MVQQWEVTEVEIDGRTFWVRPVGSWVLDSGNVVLDALQPEITVTGQKVKLKLGVSPVDSLLLTTERTSASLHGCNRQSQWGGRHLGWMT